MVRKKKKHKKEDRILLFFFFAGAVVVGLFFLFFSQKQKTSPMQSTTGSFIEATFVCEGDKTIEATFSNEKVNLLLSDGRMLNLTQTISADGARYASEDESFVFWNKGDSAFVEEGKNTTFTNCREAE